MNLPEVVDLCNLVTLTLNMINTSEDFDIHQTDDSKLQNRKDKADVQFTIFFYYVVLTRNSLKTIFDIPQKQKAHKLSNN